MHLLYLKPILYSVLNFSLLNIAPDINDLVIIKRHAVILQHVALIIRHPAMITSMQKICKEKLADELIQVMQTPPPAINKIKSYFYPEAVEMMEGKRSFDEKNYQKIEKEIYNIIEKEKFSPEKYEFTYDNELKQEVNLALKTHLCTLREFKECSLILEDPSFRTLLTSIIMIIDLARFINVEKEDFHYASDLGMFSLEINCILDQIAIQSKNSKKLSYTEAKDLLNGLVEAILSEICALNKKIDRFNANCKCNEYHITLNDIRKINEITEKVLSCFGIQINQKH